MKRKYIKICIIILIFSINLIFSMDAGIIREVYQDQILGVIKGHLKVDNIVDENNIPKTHIYCEPPVYLTSGKCCIDTFIFNNPPLNIETAFEYIVQFYSLKAHNGYFNLDYQENIIKIGPKYWHIGSDIYEGD